MSAPDPGHRKKTDPAPELHKVSLELGSFWADMGKGRPNSQAGGTGEEGGTFRSLLGQPAFWAVVDSFIKHGWRLLCVE